MKFTQMFQNWIEKAIKPATAREQSALLDESRSALKSIIDRVESGDLKMADQTDILAKQYAAVRPIVPTAKKPIYNKAPQASAPAKPSTPAAKPAPQVSNRFASASEGLVVQAATHRFSPEADKLEARQELQSRGINVSPEGIVSKSTRGGRAFRLSK